MAVLFSGGIDAHDLPARLLLAPRRVLHSAPAPAADAARRARRRATVRSRPRARQRHALGAEPAEYRAAALQTYRDRAARARRSARRSVLDRRAGGNSNDPAQPPAIILDLDETVLDNTGVRGARDPRRARPTTRRCGSSGRPKASRRAVPGAAEFLAYAKSRGVTPFYITNRDLDEEPGTRAQPREARLPARTDTSTRCCMHGENGWNERQVPAPRPRRRVATASCCSSATTSTTSPTLATRRLAERDAIIDRQCRTGGARAGSSLPNPMYGSWERAAIGSGGTPCEQLQRKIDALR